MLMLLLAGGFSHAADLQHTLVWDLMAQGAPVGQRTLTVKYIKDSGGTSRILESFTELHGRVGPIRVDFRQRLTGHVGPHEPASFHSVVEESGSLTEIQGRWTPSAWFVTNTVNQRSRTVELELNRIDLSTADLMDPFSAMDLSHYGQARILSAETGEVLLGTVEPLGVEELRIQAQEVQVRGFAWTSPQGRSEFWFSTDGFLVKYQVQLLGIPLEAVLHEPPPGGIDDFPVSVGRSAVEVLPL